ncbi:heparin/heparan-sulfate lyase [Sphingobacterium yanglingense]|uniref:Heparin/heparan-sulfate lyase n=1 Tax=Sphingobacterium yanglingense TaxID=1437280 RepID=A0A4R6WJM8_9SPHI|nr:heparin/heparan-sulfate lyase [Sphingobacterium yanglingense]
MLKRCFLSFAIVFLMSVSYGQQEGVSVELSRGKVNKKTVKLERVTGQKERGVLLKGIAQEGYPDRLHDVELRLDVPETGWYVLEAEAWPKDMELLKRTDKTGMLTKVAYFQLGEQRVTKRIVYNNMMGGKQELGKFEIRGAGDNLKIWLPDNLVVQRVRIKPYVAPVAPAEAENYQAKVIPSVQRPRLWVNSESLPVVKGRLLAEENAPAWNKVKEVAVKPYAFTTDDRQEMFYNEELEQVIEKKAFYYLMTGNEKVGSEAVDLASRYLSVLELGNVTYGDITRELGRAIYTGALVYDWCYSLISVDVRAKMRKDFNRLVMDMEVGWPPFYGLESIINGHGNEAQICRDMLSWSIAVYDEDPEPYKYVSYSVLEQLVPMRKFEYQSPRHNQGIDYGGYRFGWEMHGAWLFYRMLGYPVFDDNIKNMPYYWLYMRTPDGKMLRDGDMFNVKYNSSDDFYWKNPQTMLLCYAYSGSAVVKAEFLKQGGLPDNPVLFLLLNDPNIKPDFDRSQLPLTKDFGPILGSMVARTGWSEEKTSSDVVAEIKGGGYHFGNHQHADAGALQIYHHGMQVGDLGLYLSYGSPYDFNFNKRSASHSMLLVRDPSEPLLFRTKTNDGGTRFSQRFPKTKEEVLSDSWYHTGEIRASATGRDAIKPSYSYFNVDLTAAYSAKVKSYARSFLFLNMERTDVPAVIVLLDELETNNADFEPYWQINTLNKPIVNEDGFVLNSQFKGKKGVAFVDMIKPKAAEREVVLHSGDSSAFVFGDLYQVKSPWPEARGTRVLVKPKERAVHTSYATVFQMTEDGAQKLPVKYKEYSNYYAIQLADRILIVAKSDRFLEEEVEINVPGDKEYEVIVTGIKDGFWNINNTTKSSRFNVNILKGNHTTSWKAKGEVFVLKPLRVYGDSEGRF